MVLRLPGFNPKHPTLAFSVNSGDICRDELLDRSLEALQKIGWRFENFENTATTLLGYTPNNITGHPDFGVRAHIEYDDFGNYTEVKLIFPDGERDCFIRGPKDRFTCIIDLVEHTVGQIDYVCGNDNCPDGCQDCLKGIEFYTTFATLSDYKIH